jgi:polar amino acid transport system substrate-binding protein
MRILTLFFLFLLPTFHLLASERILKADFRNRPPEMFVNESSISGPLKDILEAAAKQIEYKVKWRVAPFSKSLEGLNNGSVDIVPRTIRNKEREAFINYLGPISIQRKDIRFLVRKGKEKTTNRYEDIQNLRIGAKSKTAYFSKFDRDTSLKKVLIDSDEKLAGLLAENKVDAIIVLDQAPLEKAFEKRQFKNYDYALYRHAQSIGNYFGMSKKSSQKHIFLQLNQILLDMVANGQIDDIYKKYGITRELSDNNPNNLTEVEKSWLKDNPGPYRVHNELAWPPFNYNENGKPTGYSIEYMDLLARKLGLQIEYISGPDWNGFLDMMRTDQLDIMLNIAQTQDRLKYLHFTKPFVNNSIVIITRKGNESIRSLGDLVGKSVSLPKGFFQQEILEKSYPDIKLHLVNGQNEALQAVTAGIVDATIGELAVQNYLIAKGLLTNLKIAAVIPGDMMSRDLRLAVRKDQKILRDILQKGINGINQAEFLLLQKKWFGDTSQKTESKENDIKLTDEEVT